MSVRAYRVFNDEVKSQSSFNCWHDNKFFNFLLSGEGTHDGTTLDGVGTIVVPVKRVREALDNPGLDMSDSARDYVKKDIEWADDNLQESIEYECL
ncbi:MAG TPA: hypothetical protein VH280_05585 [Verrucomicrobiae bacterium]|nr:hypothetical protein [Verrucomicrobiae bacterium]